MKAKLCLVAVLFMFFSLIAIASVVAATDPVIVGKWDRTDGADKYTIYANGVTETVLPDGIHHGTWAMDGSSGYKYIFHWEHSPPGQAPFIDYVTVSADGKSYSGVNNYGNEFHCVRIGDVPAVESGSFPIVPVAVGGGIAAVTGIGAAAYRHRRVSLSSRGEKLPPSEYRASANHEASMQQGGLIPQDKLSEKKLQELREYLDKQLKDIPPDTTGHSATSPPVDLTGVSGSGPPVSEEEYEEFKRNITQTLSKNQDPNDDLQKILNSLPPEQKALVEALLKSQEPTPGLHRPIAKKRD